MADKEIEKLLEKADGEYKSLPLFKAWASSPFDKSRWDENMQIVYKFKDAPQEILDRSYEIIKRAAAVDTGAIEGLYDSNRGVTFTIAFQTAMWKAVFEKKGDKFKSLFESQLKAYDKVLDFATRAVPIGEAWIRDLHKEICSAQKKYKVITSQGEQEVDLPLGEYKKMPNHVKTKDGTIHSYAPVTLTPNEMHKFCEEITSEEFNKSHPLLQASYAHYVITAIHPFADGNGRVARALASVYTYRAANIPLLILVDNVSEYYNSLEEADKGNFSSFVSFALERVVDTILLVNESLKAATFPEPAKAYEKLSNLYVTKGGYTHAQVDEAGYTLGDLFVKLMNGVFDKLKLKSSIVEHNISVSGDVHKIESADLRHPLTKGPKNIVLHLRAGPPATNKYNMRFVIEVPKNSTKDDMIYLRGINQKDGFTARIQELTPTISPALEMRLSIYVNRIISEGMMVLEQRGIQKLKEEGY